MNNVKLYVGGIIWDGWSDATITKSIDGVFGEFTLGLTRQNAEPGVPAIRLGSTCRLTLDGETVIAGFIAARTLTVDDTIDLQITGRDKTALLFKGSVLRSPAEWAGQDALQIITDICKPFDVSVRADVAVGKAFEKFTAQPGDTAQKVIERICRHRGLLFHATADGNLALTTPGKGGSFSDTISMSETGGNATSLNLTESLEDRHDQYICRTQNKGTNWGSSDHNKIEGRAVDAGMNLYSPTIIIADEPGDTSAMKALATATAALNAARAETRTYTVDGWRTDSDHLWAINKTVNLDDQIEGYRGQRLIKKVIFTITEKSAPETALTLVDPKAFDLRAEPEKSTGDVW
ncbi:phage baseplate assembly protein [Thalassospira sp. MCCC 1A01428]|uniref:phage baseplate assembly protein n=1 Tax=Thalassospira sp. MCCC 1A01428 TaxID=1470575 RepID=UPI000A1E19F7|nr:hypothetical protein [Thalassospira sp. MCCC 1A01428]OSQ41674.1 hypothetical protein THS27_18365 [Thalassospira sp. MCCC 1A01428]